MCSLYGILDYKGYFSGKEKGIIISVLSTECEVRGTDATGIAYVSNGFVSVYKRPLPAHKMKFFVPNGVRCVMGHTRMTTQGSEKLNYNNHPFVGSVKGDTFALAHNGILMNDTVLRKSENLPPTKIQTDTYAAVQLIEKEKELSVGSLKTMAEKLEGVFTFTVLDANNNLYFIKGDNPMEIYHFPKQGFYVYASTKEILDKALWRLGVKWQFERIGLKDGDILRIDSCGGLKIGKFEMQQCWGIYGGYCGVYGGYYHGFGGGTGIRGCFPPSAGHEPPRESNDNTFCDLFGIDAEYYEMVVDLAKTFGYCREDIEGLLMDGFSLYDIEEFFYESRWNMEVSIEF